MKTIRTEELLRLIEGDEREKIAKATLATIGNARLRDLLGALDLDDRESAYNLLGTIDKDDPAEDLARIQGDARRYSALFAQVAEMATALGSEFLEAA